MTQRTKRPVATIHPEIETRVSVLEQTVLMQNTAVNKQLEGIARVVGEIHDKVDKHLLDQAVKTTTIDMATKRNAEDLEKSNKRIDKKFATWRNTVVAIVVAIIGGAFSVWAAYLK